MIIQRISSNKAASGLYVFNNNNYSQVNGVPVNPVRPVRKLPGLEREEEQRNTAGTGNKTG